MNLWESKQYFSCSVSDVLLLVISAISILVTDTSGCGSIRSCFGNGGIEELVEILFSLEPKSGVKVKEAVEELSLG